MSDGNLQVLRAIDKYDRVGDLGVFELLTTGRLDQSGDFTAGCGLSNAQAAALVGFLNVGRDTLIERRFWMMSTLESMVDESGMTEFDRLLATNPPNIAHALDDLFDALAGRLGRNPMRRIA